LKQKKFVPPTFRQSSQLRKRDQNTYFSVPRKTIENAAPYTGCTNSMISTKVAKVKQCVFC